MLGLRDRVQRLALDLEVTTAGPARSERERLLGQLDDYLIPRLRRMDAPLLAVVGGSTGAGKSTLVNSLVRREVSRSGVLRPTTRSPVLVHHPNDSGAFLTQRVLPGLARVTSEAPEPVQPIEPDAPRVTALRLVPHEGIPQGLAVVDAPDIDSVVETNRDLAVQLLAAADLWLFVTTAARYADALPWDLLRQAVERGVAVAIVLDRVPPAAMHDVRLHLAGMLRERGLATAPMFTIPETRMANGFLPLRLVAPLKEWLVRLAKDARSRDVVVARTLGGALRSLPDRVDVLAPAADDQVAAERALRSVLDEVYQQARSEIAERLSDGTLLRGEVLARWQEFVGTGQLIRSLEAGVSRMRDRVVATLRARPAPAVEPLGEALQTSVEAMVRAQAVAAAEQAVLRWRATPAGFALVGRRPDLTSPSPAFDTALDRMVRDWQTWVLDLVRTQGQSRRGTARALSLGVNGTGVVLMLVAFAHTGGLAGVEVGVAAGAAALAQRVLEAVFGDQAVRSLAAKARKDLLRRVEVLLASERARMEALLGTSGDRAGKGDELRAAVQAVKEVH
ncbi:MAG: ABC transporter [Actinomycetales bacterium]|nr:ABC transporter [Actinomycetales bacterium]